MCTSRKMCAGARPKNIHCRTKRKVRNVQWRKVRNVQGSQRTFRSTDLPQAVCEQRKHSAFNRDGSQSKSTPID